MSVADSISFSNFCQLCAKIKNASQEKKLTILQNYITTWKDKAKDLKDKKDEVDSSFYPILRLLLPHLDRERGAYGVKERALARVYVSILSLPKDGRDAQKLLNYRSTNAVGGDTCDFAEVAYWILKNRCTEGGELSVGDVNDHLDRIASSHALNAQKNVDSELVSLLKSTSADEQKWLIRLLLKEIKLGVSDSGILKCYHPDARDFYDANNSLRKVSDVLTDPNVRLNEIEVELFEPFKPMLSEECNIQKIDVYFKKSSHFYVETKLDGERFQIHMKEGTYKYYSRNGYDFTSNFGGTVHEGSLTPRIASRFSPKVKSCILDGEMMSWNETTQTFASKGKNLDVKNLKEDNCHRPCFCVFDVLFYNGQVLTNKPLNLRLEVLQDLIEPLEGSITFVDRKKVSTKGEITDSLNEAIDNREEGIVMKEFMSVYKPNVRKNGGWYKVKPEYIDGLSDTLDLLIIGGYYGSGRRGGKISHFLLGVAATSANGNKLFQSAGKVGSGYSMSELDDLLNRLEPHWRPVKRGESPECIEWTKEKPDVWIEPDKSFLVEVKAAEIIESNVFRTGYTLRFPRVEKIRYDKSWENCLTLEEFEAKREMASGKLASLHLNSDDGDYVTPKKRPKLSVWSPRDKVVDASSIEQISDLLRGREICVLSGFADVTKQDIERKVIEFGGTVVKNPGKRTYCVLAEDGASVRIKNIMKSELYDVVYSSRFFGLLTVENDRLPELTPSHYLAMSSQTRQSFSRSYDRYGDHYTEPVTKETLAHSMIMADKEMSDFVLTPDQIYEMDVELFNGPSPYGLFRNCTAYFDSYENLSDSTSAFSNDLDLCKIDFQFRGGNCSDSIDKVTTHVVVFSNPRHSVAPDDVPFIPGLYPSPKEWMSEDDVGATTAIFLKMNLERLDVIKAVNRRRGRRKFHIVTEKWIESSIRNGSLSEYKDAL